MREIALNQGLVALVDADDFDRVVRIPWVAVKKPGEYTYYVLASNRKPTTLMHRFVLRLCPGDGVVDHRNGDGLDNRRANLRHVTHAENAMNKRPHGRSRFKGVDFVRATSRWRARIAKNGSRVLLGYFDSEIEAAQAYDEAAEKLFGSFAFLNFKRTGARCLTTNP